MRNQSGPFREIGGGGGWGQALPPIRDWSLITGGGGGGGYKMGVHVKFHPYEKRGWKKF